MISFFSAIILSYLLGSIPTSVMLGKLFKKIDLREFGSANAGASNAFRVLGWKIALIVLIFDIGKGTIATVIFFQNSIFW